MDDIDSIGDVFNAYKAARRQKRENNRKQSVLSLMHEAIPFESHNDGVHIIIKTPVRIDFWPGTGLWKTADGKIEQRGVRNLINFYRKKS